MARGRVAREARRPASLPSSLDDRQRAPTLSLGQRRWRCRRRRPRATCSISMATVAVAMRRPAAVGQLAWARVRGDWRRARATRPRCCCGKAMAQFAAHARQAAECWPRESHRAALHAALCGDARRRRSHLGAVRRPSRNAKRADRNGYTPLLLAIVDHHWPAVELLLRDVRLGEVVSQQAAEPPRLYCAAATSTRLPTSENIGSLPRFILQASRA